MLILIQLQKKKLEHVSSGHRIGRRTQEPKWGVGDL